MSDESKKVEIVTRASNATTAHTTVRLNELKSDDRYCHRDADGLKETSLAGIMNSLKIEDLQMPIVYFVNEHGEMEMVDGHRRWKACRILAEKNVPGFTLDMEVDAIEVKNASHADLLVRSISDNAVRLDLTRAERVRVVKKLHDAGVPVERAAAAMNVSEKTFKRDLLIAENPWMFDHVIGNSISPSHAIELLDKLAEKPDRAAEMREHLDGFIAEKQQMIGDMEKKRMMDTGKELADADKEVQKYLSKELVDHWKKQLGENNPLDDDATANFPVAIDTETGLLTFGSMKRNLGDASATEIAKLAAKTSRLTKQLALYHEKVREKEARGEGAPKAVESPFDLDFLRAMGREDIANELKEQMQLAKEPDGEEVPQELPAERQEEDLTEEIELPQPAPAAASPPPLPPPLKAAAAATPPPPPAKKSQTAKGGNKK